MLVNTTCSESFETLSKLLIWVVKDFRLSVLARPLVNRSSWWLRMPKMQQENAALNSSLNFPVNHKNDSWKNCTINCILSNFIDSDIKELSKAKLTWTTQILFQCRSRKSQFNHPGEKQKKDNLSKKTCEVWCEDWIIFAR